LFGINSNKKWVFQTNKPTKIGPSPNKLERREMKLKKITQVFIAIGMMQSIVMVSQAQEAPKKEEKVQKVEVIGSNIKRTSVEGPSPIQSLKAEDIMRSGATNLTELLQTLPSITSGGQEDITSGNGFAAGTATASMRGMGSSSTLILINGRRMAASPAVDPNSGQSTLFNINSIPLSMVERVDVLLDAASAVYGSDAMAGVINFILKKEYKGLAISGRAAFADQGDFASQGVNLYGGFGDYEDNGYNIMYSIDLKNRPSTPYTRTKGINMHQVENTYLFNTTTKQPVKITDLDSTFTFTPNYWPETKVGSNSYTTATALEPKLCPQDQITTSLMLNGSRACGVDLSQWQQFVSQQKSANAFLSASFKINDNLSASIQLSSDRIETTYGQGFATLGNTTSVWFDPTGKLRSFRYTMAANHPDNPLFQANSNNQLRVLTTARLADVPTSNNVINSSNRLVAEISGTNFGWDWNSGILLNNVKRNQTVLGRINGVTALAALDKYRFGGVNSPELLQQISQAATQNGSSDVYIVDLKGSRELGNISGRAIGVAAGVEFKQEKFLVSADQNTAAGNFVRVGGSRANGSRNVGSFFTEVNVPLLKSLEVGAAVRYDHFSDYGSNTTPQLKMQWKALDTLSFRGSYAQGFRAPTLGQVSESSVSSIQSISGYVDAVRCPLINGVPARIPGATGYLSTNECNNATTSSREISAFIVANPNLKPETSNNKGFGIVFAPNNKFSSTIDFYEIHRKNEVDRLSSMDVLRKFYENGDTSYANAFFRSDDEAQQLKDAKGNIIPGAGAIAGVKRRYDNFGSTRVRGADINMLYRLNMGEMGRLDTKADLGYIHSYIFQRAANGPYTNLTDNGDNPKFKGSLTLTWINGSLTTFGKVNYVSDYALERTESGAGTRIECSPTISSSPLFAASVGGDCRASSWTTFDFGVTYRASKQLTFNATMRNAFGKEAPVDPFYRGAPYYNSVLHNIRGRNFSLSGTYKFF
jgi:iron complex outermembrane receptor protein